MFLTHGILELTQVNFSRNRHTISQACHKQYRLRERSCLRSEHLHNTDTTFTTETQCWRNLTNNDEKFKVPFKAELSCSRSGQFRSAVRLPHHGICRFQRKYVWSEAEGIVFFAKSDDEAETKHETPEAMSRQTMKQKRRSLSKTVYGQTIPPKRSTGRDVWATTQ